MQWVKLGDYIEQCDERNSSNVFSENDVKGISTTKIFIATKANLEGVSLSSYKLVKQEEFAFVPDTSRRGDKISLSFNNLEKPCIVSSISCVFKIKNKEKLLPNYLYLWFCRQEFDRYARFNSWGSAREAFSYDDMCRIEIPLPSIEEQQKIVDIYNGLKNLKEQNLKLYQPLMDLCQSYLQELKKKYTLVELGGYIEQRREKNSDFSVKKLIGVGSNGFIQPKQTKDETNGHICYIVRNNNFVFAPPQIHKGAIDYYTQNELAKCSDAYSVFNINNNALNPHYLFIILKSKSFQQYATYYREGVREQFNYNNLCRYKIPLPPIEIQQAIVNIYNCAKNAKYISENANKLIDDICPALIRQVIGDN